MSLLNSLWSTLPYFGGSKAAPTAVQPPAVSSANANTTLQRTVRILSLDGGGIRGIIELEFLEKIEEITGRAISELFDLIATTSTGTIIGLALTVPGADGKPRYTAKKVKEVFMAKAAEVFPHSIFGKLEQLYEAEYSRKGLNSLGKEFYGDVKMKEAMNEVVVTSYNATTGQPWLFEKKHIVIPPQKNNPEEKHRFDESASKLDGGSLSMLDVMEASTAAPTYFPLKKLLIDGKEYLFADGGLQANNPVLCGISRAKEIFNNPDVVICSLGTGYTPVKMPFSKQDCGDLQIATKILDILMNASLVQTYEQMKGLFPEAGKERKFYRFQTTLPEDLSPLDDAKDIPQLLEIARSVIKAVEPQIKELCTKLLAVSAKR